MTRYVFISPRIDCGVRIGRWRLVVRAVELTLTGTLAMSGAVRSVMTWLSLFYLLLERFGRSSVIYRLPWLPSSKYLQLWRYISYPSILHIQHSLILSVDTECIVAACWYELSVVLNGEDFFPIVCVTAFVSHNTYCNDCKLLLVIYLSI